MQLRSAGFRVDKADFHVVPLVSKKRFIHAVLDINGKGKRKGNAIRWNGTRSPLLETQT